MNKTELIAAVAEKAEISKKDAEKAVKAFTDAVAEELAKGGKVFWPFPAFLSGPREPLLLRSNLSFHHRIPRGVCAPFFRRSHLSHHL